MRKHKIIKNTKLTRGKNTRKGATMFYHFEYTSGGNPYIAKTEKERDRIIKKHITAGDKVTETKTGFYIIDDKHNTPAF